MDSLFPVTLTFENIFFTKKGKLTAKLLEISHCSNKIFGNDFSPQIKTCWVQSFFVQDLEICLFCPIPLAFQSVRFFLEDASKTWCSTLTAAGHGRGGGRRSAHRVPRRVIHLHDGRWREAAAVQISNKSRNQLCIFSNVLWNLTPDCTAFYKTQQATHVFFQKVTTHKDNKTTEKAPCAFLGQKLKPYFLRKLITLSAETKKDNLNLFQLSAVPRILASLWK